METYFTAPQEISSPTFDRDGRLFVVSGGSGTVYQVVEEAGRVNLKVSAQ